MSENLTQTQKYQAAEIAISVLQTVLNDVKARLSENATRDEILNVFEAVLKEREREAHSEANGRLHRR